MKLNLGSGEQKIAGYENLDIKHGEEVSDLVQYADNSLDEIRASHILEHFSHNQVYQILQGWVNKLKVGGVLKIAVPDFAKIASGYVNGENLNYAGYLMGGQTDKDDYHKAIFDRKGLVNAFENLGLADIKEWQSGIQDCASLPISLNLQGQKKHEHKKTTVPSGKDAQSLVDSLADKAKNIYSQNGEDGIIEGIFEKIGTKNQWCLEVGAADGIMFSNTRALVEKGWKAILIESDKATFERLVENCKKYPLVQCVHATIKPNGIDSLDTILTSCGAPEDIDLVCIDIDGQDWHVWNQMTEYKPRVVMVEYAPEIDNEDFIPAIGMAGQAGLEAVRKLCSSKGYHGLVVTDTNVIAINNEAISQTSKTQTVNKKTYNIKAVMSMPRLCFADNIFSAVGALVPLGIPIERGIGVFWGQVLTRLMDSHLNDGTDFIITIDYDTYFTKDQVVKLINLMHAHPEYDAICPLQMKREEDSPLFGKKNTDGTRAETIQVPLNEDLIPISSGHFGLSIFRVKSLKKLKKPWFVGVPDSNGDWGDGRMDEDIWFWKNFSDSGLKLAMAHKIGLGHLQLLTTFPGRPQDNYKPVHLYNNDVQLKGMPNWCKGESIEN